METTMNIKEQIKREYAEFVNDYGMKPNVVLVKVQWNDEQEVRDVTETIVLDCDRYNEDAAENGESNVVPFVDDEEVLFYCSGLEDLLEMCDKETTFGDFVIKKLELFDHYNY